MAATSQKLICLSGMNLDVAPQYLQTTQARFVKNLYYQLSDLGDAGDGKGANTGVQKQLRSNEIYYPFALPAGENSVIGTYPCIETSELYAFVHNSLSNHFIFRINGDQRTIDALPPSSCFNFQLKPQYFIGEGQCHLEVIYVTNPDTDELEIKKDLYWTDGFGYQGYVRFDDYLNTNGFDAATFSYFNGSYDKCSMLRMGLLTPNDCIKIDQVPYDISDTGKNDNLKFSSWQFRVLFIDVFGRPSEHGMISDLFYLSNNACLSASDMLSRCVNLTFDAGNPLIDKIQIEYRNCNSGQWYLDSVLDLYEGNALGEWWTRIRNTDVNYNHSTNQITYTFCKDKLCDPLDPTETSRTEPQLPRTSQAIGKIGKNIQLSNNKDGFRPFSKKDVLNKLSIEIDNPVNSNIGKTSNITIWVRIFNPHQNNFQKVWKQGTNYVFGGIANGTGIANIKSDYQQYFAVPSQKGFFGYLAGTNNYAIGVQYHLDASNNFVLDTDFTQEYDTPYYMKFEFLSVPKGVYLFRIASHLADPSVVDITTTSTFVGGIWQFSNYNVGSNISRTTYELEVDVCNDDYDTLTAGRMLLIFDLTNPRYYGNRANPFVSKGHFSDATVINGYIYESVNVDTGEKQFPVSLLGIRTDTSGNNVQTSPNTDHNGFFFSSAIRASIISSGSGGHFNLYASGYCKCIRKDLIKIGFGALYKTYTDDGVLGAASLSPIVTYCNDFDTSVCSRVLIKGTLKLCNSNTGIPNINVVISRGQIATTDAEGNFSVRAYDDVLNGSTIGKVYILGGACSFTACDGGCIATLSYSFNPCVSCVTRSVDAGTTSLLFVSNRGLLSGGRYGVSLYGYDWLGRRGFAQTTDKLYFNIPSINQLQMFGFSQVSLLIPNSVTFDSWVDYITVGITHELNYGGNYISWIVDKVTFVDNSGNENDAAPTQIRIDYASLNEYNAKNNFNTTTGWQITPEATATDTAPSPRTGDIVQFIRNGDGTWFSSPITALIKYDVTGQYFLINYTDNLANLKENSLIRLANPQDCTNKDQFYDLCGKIKVINGKAQTNKILLNAFDTYYQYRQIPVPVTVTSGDPPVTSTVIELRQFGFPFESPSITDTWGYLCWNLGNFGVTNPYENEILSLNQIALSGALSPNAQLNYLNYFDSSNRVNFNVNDTGGIIYVRVKTGMLLVVCQFKNFIVGYGDNIARINSENIVSVPSGADTFGKPERSSTGDYGCQLFDKNTIRERNGLIQWLDRNRVAILQNDFQNTVDVSRYNEANSTIISWLTNKIKFQESYNTANGKVRYFHSVINPSNFEWILSEFTIGGDSFANEERDYDVTRQETISFDTLAKVWKQFMSPTPEYMGFLEGSNIGQLLFMFKHGVAYSNTGSTFNVFFDVPCESVYQFILSNARSAYRTPNKFDEFKKKKFISMYVMSTDKLFWSDEIKTEKQVSRLLKSQFKKEDYFYSAPFLCDLNTAPDPNILEETGINVIMDGDNLFGSWLQVRLIGDSDGSFGELTGVIVFLIGDEQSGSDG